MVKKSRKEKYAGKTREEWRNWGERFGIRLEKGTKNFEEELGNLGKDLGKYMEHKGKRLENKCKTVFLGTFGLIGPLIGSIFGLVLFAVGIWLLNLINAPLNNNFILWFSDFLSTNLPWFFGAMLFFSYAKYFSRGYPEIYWIASPLVRSIGLTIFVWIVAWVLYLISIFVENNAVYSVSLFLYGNLLKIFFLFVILSYVVTIFWKFGMKKRSYK